MVLNPGQHPNIGHGLNKYTCISWSHIPIASIAIIPDTSYIPEHDIGNDLGRVPDGSQKPRNVPQEVYCRKLRNYKGHWRHILYHTTLARKGPTI